MLAEALSRTLAAIRRSGRRRGGRHNLPLGLTPVQLELVRLLDHQPDLSISEAASEMRLAPNSVSTLVRQLTRTGVMRRRTDPTDRRLVRIELAPEVRRALALSTEGDGIGLARAIEELSDEDQRLIAAALPALARLSDELGRAGEPTSSAIAD